MTKKAAGLVGAKSNFLNHRSLRQRFRATLSGALPLLTSAIAIKLPIAIESVILEQSQASHEPDERVLNAIAIGLWQHQDLRTLPHYFTHLDDLVVALLIALACRDALNPKTAIADICDFLQNSLVSSNAISTLVEQLQLARTLVEQGASSAIVRTILLSKMAISIVAISPLVYTFGLVRPMHGI
ncbi:MAG: hypothetical protein HC770_09565 [Pseudanabaena sp. CRU_2_10]|nr:hypothetical protein [Pseudanabaena sp. CRU_2_10]